MQQLRVYKSFVVSGLLKTRIPPQTSFLRSCSSSKDDDEEQQQKPKPPENESIIDRLQRLSRTTPEEFPARSQEEVAAAKSRYESVLRDFDSKFYRDEVMRSRNPNYRNNYGNNRRFNDGGNWRDGGYSSRGKGGGWDRGGGGGGGWDDDINWQQRREFSTSSRVFEENVLGRLQRLSKVTAEEYSPSEGALKVRKEAEFSRSSSREFSAEDVDQRNNFKKHNFRRNSQNFNEGDGDKRPQKFDRRQNFQNQRNNYQNYEGGDDGTQKYDRRQNFQNHRRNSQNFGEADDGHQKFEKRKPTARFSPNDENFDIRQPSRTWRQEERDERYQNFSTYSERIRKTKLDRSGRNLEPSGQISSSPVSPQQKPLEKDLDLEALLSGDDGDIFGTLSVGAAPVKDYVGAALSKELKADEAEFLGLGAEEEEDDVGFKPEVKWNMKKLVKRIQQLVDEQKVKEAVDTLLSALTEGGFQYDYHSLLYAYNLCISSAAQVGYVKMAWRLFNDMKKRAIIPRHSTYTSLFNAAANSAWDAEGNIERMNALRENMREKGVIPNQIVYHAMIKGYGRNGDIESAFGVVDEMITLENLMPNTETFNMLLQACISDTTNGFRHLLVTWRKLTSMSLRPDIHSYNLLIRGVRECGILPPPNASALKPESKFNCKFLPPIVSQGESDQLLDTLCIQNDDSEKSLVKLGDGEGETFSLGDLLVMLKAPENRLAVFGGLRGFLSQMAADKVGPNLKTITELGQIIHPGDVGDLVMLMKSYKLKPDIVFFNLMIKRFNDAQNGEGARELLKSLSQFDLSPNIMTWGVLATGAGNIKSATALLDEMDTARFVPNIQIMGGLLLTAVRSFNPSYVTWLLDETRRRDVTPDPKFLLMVEEFKQTVRKGLLAKEQGQKVVPYKLAEILEDAERFEVVWKKFLFRYDIWSKSVKVGVEPKDPWAEDFANFRKNKSHGTLNQNEAQVEN